MKRNQIISQWLIIPLNALIGMLGLGVRIANSSGMDAMYEVGGKVEEGEGEGDKVKSFTLPSLDEHCAYLATLTLNPFFLTEEKVR